MAMSPNLPEILEGEVEPDAEHQQDDAELRELMDRRAVALIPRGERAEGHARQHVAHDRRQSDPPGEKPADQGIAERDRNRNEKW